MMRNLSIVRGMFCCLCLMANDVQGTESALSKSVKMQTTLEWARIYAEIRGSLTTDQIYAILDRGIELASRTDLANTLADGGTAFFSHCDIRECGDQVAAVVHASLQACANTGKDQILLIGVMHPLTKTLQDAWLREKKGNIFNDPCCGIFGPGLPNEELLCKEFSLDSFVFLLEQAAKRQGIQPPNVVMRYPNLVAGQPEFLPGIEELKQLAAKSIVVATGDLCHHGTAYVSSGQVSDGIEEKIPISQAAHGYAYQTIKENLHLLSGHDLLAYRKYCFKTFSDTSEVGQVLRFLLGPLEGHIRDLRLVDVSEYFPDKPQPNWVAATLVELKSKNSL